MDLVDLSVLVRAADHAKIAGNQTLRLERRKVFSYEEREKALAENDIFTLITILKSWHVKIPSRKGQEA